LAYGHRRMRQERTIIERGWKRGEEVEVVARGVNGLIGAVKKEDHPHSQYPLKAKLEDGRGGNGEGNGRARKSGRRRTTAGPPMESGERGCDRSLEGFSLAAKSRKSV